eukprot:c6700_g1_i1.p1 GENE.c6700_g1_i1~~c6700_g1_i1.p1  ORF type:complete len:178 (-),score=39.87 c6700_g1_i1:158-691(-)
MIGSTLSGIIEVVLGLMCPAYATFKCLKHGTEAEQQQWLVFWIVNAWFLCFGFFADIFLSWLPMYYETKVALLLWMVLPQTQGGIFLYNNYLLGALESHEDKIDQIVNQAQSAATEHVNSVMASSKTAVATHTTSIVNGVQTIVSSLLLAGLNASNNIQQTTTTTTTTTSTTEKKAK